jgi:CHAD domain-containing protein
MRELIRHDGELILRSQKELSKDIRRYAANRLRKLKKTFQIVIDRRDSEAVHDFRKTTRNLQCVVDACGIRRSTRRAKKIRLGLKSWRHALSAWRDGDVMIELIRQAQQNAHSTYERQVWSAIAERTEKQRKQASKKFLKNADFRKLRKLRAKTVALVKNQAKAEPMMDNLGCLLQQAWQKLNLAIDEFERVANVANLHAVRIKAKTLRYALNLRQKFYSDKQLEDSSVWLKELQDQIGGWHDELMLSGLMRTTLSKSNTTSDPKAAKVIEGIKEQEIAMAESARNYLLSVREKHEYKRLRRVLSAAIYATSKNTDAEAMAHQSVTGPIH